MNKKQLIVACAIALLLGGCSALMPDVSFPVRSKEYSCFIDKRYEVISPLTIVKSKGEWGGYWLWSPEFSENKHIRFITNVPVGSIIVTDHVSQGGGYWFREKTTSYIGRFETPGIFKGGFELSSFIELNRDEARAKFCERFAGMDGKYLRELQ